MTTKIDIVSGFLGAGKTTLIKKLLKEKLSSEKVVLIENEFGEIGIDSGILRDSGIEIKEMNSGCICCSLTGDFTTSLKEVFKRYSPDRVIIEPSGVGKLSAVIEACRKIEKQMDARINMCIAVVDAIKYKMYINNFGEFFQDQIKNAKTIVLSRTKNTEQDKLALVVKDIQKHNINANIITTDWDILKSETIISVAEQDDANSLESEIRLKVKLHKNHCSCGRHHHYNDDNSSCSHNHNHEQCECKEHNHSANEVFSNWGVETPHIFNEDAIRNILQALNNTSVYGMVLRAKGIIPIENGKWIQFDFVPEEFEIRPIAPDYTGRICVIGKKINSTELIKLFKV